MAAGDFTTSQVPILQQTAREAWEMSRANRSQSIFDPSTEVMKAIMENDVSAAFKQYITLPDNCLGVQIDWMETNPTVTVDSSFTNHQVVPCDVTGPQNESKSQVYQLTHRLQTSFSIPEVQCQNIFSYADKYAQLSLEYDRALVAALSAHALNRLHGFAGQNLVPTASNLNIGTIDSGNLTVTRVNPANLAWQDFYPYLATVSDFNRFRNPFLLDGTAFSRQRFLAAVAAGTIGDTGASIAFDQERYYADARTFNAAGITNKLFYISQGAIAMATAARNPTADKASFYNTSTGPVMRYQEPIAGLTYPNGAPIMKDVFVKQTTQTTTGTNNCIPIRSFEYELPFELFLNPKTTGDGVTGVIEFQVDSQAPVATPS